MSGWKILCDFDGTIVASDVTDYLLERFADPAWHELERSWELGQIGARECMQRQVALLEAAPGVLDEAVAAMAVDPAFPAFVAFARRMGIPLTVVSDGLDRVIKDVLRRSQLTNVEIRSSQFAYRGDGRWRLEFPYADPECLSLACTCKCEIAKADELRTLLIGDGRSDFCVAEASHFVFAKHKLLEYCRAREIPHVPFTDFAEAQGLLAYLISHTTAAPVVERITNE
jgi:2-hydroxy-3-keto-5-methylthiopentenyl-1-phosphate phosphatase